MYTRYNVNCKVDLLLNEIKEQYNVPDDFYGDCYPREVLELESKAELAKNDEDFQYYLNEIVEIFSNYAKSYNENE